MVLLHDILIKITNEALQSVDHVVDLYAVYKLGIIAEFCLHSIELSVELLKVGESTKVHPLDVISDVLITEEVLDYLVAQNNFLHVCSGLLQPLFEKSRANLSPSLV